MMGCSNCEKTYMRNLDHVRILAKHSANITKQDQYIYKVNGRIPYYAFSGEEKTEFIEIVRFDRDPADITVLSDNEDQGLDLIGRIEPVVAETERGELTADLGYDIGAVLPDSKPKKVQRPTKKGSKG